jgi:hypothetical protein
MLWRGYKMRKKIVIFISLLIIFGWLLLLSPCISSQEQDNMMVNVILTVEGEIQIEDVWTTGDSGVNQLAKPMYYLWFDYNGNPDDARYGNGAGPVAHQFRFDTGWLYLEVYNGEGIKYGPITETTEESNDWADSEYNIRASLVDNGRSLSIRFPLSLMNNPASLEVSAMASPWTNAAFDNTGSGSGSADGWIIIDDTTVENNYEESDVLDESLTWPSELPQSDLLPNFNIEKLEVQLYREDSSENLNGFGIELWLILIFVIILIIIIAVIFLKNKK